MQEIEFENIRKIEISKSEVQFLYIKKSSEVRKGIEFLHFSFNIENDLSESSKYFVFGFDLEFEKSGRPCTIQISTSRVSVLFHVSSIGYVQRELVQFLENPSTLFVGVGVFFDASKLWRHLRIKITNIVDLSNVLVEEGVFKERIGLKEIEGQMCGMSILEEKTRNHKFRRKSQWNDETLMWSEIEYACLDAFIGYVSCVVVFKFLNVHQDMTIFDFYVERVNKKFLNDPRGRMTEKYKLFEGTKIPDIILSKIPWKPSRSKINLLEKLRKVRWKYLSKKKKKSDYDDDVDESDGKSRKLRNIIGIVSPISERDENVLSVLYEFKEGVGEKDERRRNFQFQN